MSTAQLIENANKMLHELGDNSTVLGMCGSGGVRSVTTQTKRG